MSSRVTRASTRRKSYDALARQTEREVEWLSRMKSKRERKGRGRPKALDNALNEVNMECNSPTPKKQRSKSRPRKTLLEWRKGTEKPLNAILSESDAYEPGTPTQLLEDDDDFSMHSWMDLPKETTEQVLQSYSLVSEPSVINIQKELTTMHENMSTLFKDQQEHEEQMLGIKSNVKTYFEISNRYVKQVKYEMDNLRKVTEGQIADLQNKLDRNDVALSKAVFTLEEKVVVLQSESVKEEKVKSKLEGKTANLELTALTEKKKKQAFSLMRLAAVLLSMVPLLAMVFNRRMLLDVPTFFAMVKNDCLDRFAESIESGIGYLIYFLVPYVTRSGLFEKSFLGIMTRYVMDVPGAVGLLALTTVVILSRPLRQLTWVRTIAIAVIFYFI